MSPPIRPASRENRLIDALPAASRTRLLAACERIDLPAGTDVASAGEAAVHVLFPVRCAISSMLTMDSRHHVEVAFAGWEGMYGVAAARAEWRPLATSRARLGGVAWRIGAAALRRCVEGDAPLARVLDGYRDATSHQLVRAIGCHRFHGVGRRLPRQLLMTADRARQPSFAATHESLGEALGARRAGVTEAALVLQREGLIENARGTVTILDRAGLLRASCGCYRADLADYRRALGSPRRAAAGDQ